MTECTQVLRKTICRKVPLQVNFLWKDCALPSMSLIFQWSTSTSFNQWEISIPFFKECTRASYLGNNNVELQITNNENSKQIFPEKVARPQSQFPTSICLLCCRKYADQSWEYINRSQSHKSEIWDWKGRHKWGFHCSVLEVGGGGGPYLAERLAPAMVLEAFPLEEAALVLLHHRLLLLRSVELLGRDLLSPLHAQNIECLLD